MELIDMINPETILVLTKIALQAMSSNFIPDSSSFNTLRHSNQCRRWLSTNVETRSWISAAAFGARASPRAGARCDAQCTHEYRRASGIALDDIVEQISKLSSRKYNEDNDKLLEQIVSSIKMLKPRNCSLNSLQRLTVTSYLLILSRSAGTYMSGREHMIWETVIC